MPSSKRGKRLCLLAAVALLLPAAWLWFTLLSPWGYTAPAGIPSISRNSTHHVFVYGTLTHAWVRWLVTGEHLATRHAQLSGYRREGLNLAPDSRAVTQGQLLTVTADQLIALDRYERLGIRYQRICLPLASDRHAWVYTRLPASGNQLEPDQGAQQHCQKE